MCAQETLFVATKAAVNEEMTQRLVIVLTIIGLAHSKSLNLTCKEIKRFVNGHNSRRLQVAKGELKDQPSAYNMKSVVWDKELAAKAAEWASKDKLTHNVNRTIASQRFITGENMYWWSSSAHTYRMDPQMALRSWFKEHRKYTFSSFSESQKPFSHYTQMVWSDSTYIGCAISRKRLRKWIQYIVVCNYGPSGNIEGMTPYKPVYGVPAAGSNRLVCGAASCNNPYGDRCKKRSLRLDFDFKLSVTD